MDQVIYTLPQFSARNQVGRTRVYQEINSGRLKVVKIGRSVRVTAGAELEWHRLLEAEANPKKVPA